MTTQNHVSAITKTQNHDTTSINATVRGWKRNDYMKFVTLLSSYYRIVSYYHCVFAFQWFRIFIIPRFRSLCLLVHNNHNGIPYNENLISHRRNEIKFDKTKQTKQIKLGKKWKWFNMLSKYKQNYRRHCIHFVKYGCS